MKRRVVYTKEAIALSSNACNTGIKNFDAIPMFQIKSVCASDKMSESSSQAGPCSTDDACESRKTTAPTQRSDQSQPISDNTMKKLANSFQIKTSEDGLNCGRSYHLKARHAWPSLQRCCAQPFPLSSPTISRPSVFPQHASSADPLRGPHLAARDSDAMAGAIPQAQSAAECGRIAAELDALARCENQSACRAACAAHAACGREADSLRGRLALSLSLGGG